MVTGDPRGGAGTTGTEEGVDGTERGTEGTGTETGDTGTATATTTEAAEELVSTVDVCGVVTAVEDVLVEAEVEDGAAGGALTPLLFALPLACIWLTNIPMSTDVSTTDSAMYAALFCTEENAYT